MLESRYFQDRSRPQAVLGVMMQWLSISTPTHHRTAYYACCGVQRCHATAPSPGSTYPEIIFNCGVGESGGEFVLSACTPKLCGESKCGYVITSLLLAACLYWFLPGVDTRRRPVAFHALTSVPGPGAQARWSVCAYLAWSTFKTATLSTEARIGA